MTTDPGSSDVREAQYASWIIAPQSSPVTPSSEIGLAPRTDTSPAADDASALGSAAVTATTAGTRKDGPRQRSRRPLPTDRMKMDLQKRVLDVIARLSGDSQRPLDAEQIGNELGVSAATAPLSNSFFIESKWIERMGKGKYIATPALNRYHRALAAGERDATRSLRDAAAGSWYWAALQPSLTSGPVAIGDAIDLLATEADAGPDHRAQLENLVTWMDYVGLVQVVDDALTTPYRRSETTLSSTESNPGASTADNPSGAGPAPTAAPSPSGASGPAGEPSATVLAWNWDFTLTAADLARFSPGQISALFAAIGEIATIVGKTPHIEVGEPG